MSWIEAWTPNRWPTLFPGSNAPSGASVSLHNVRFKSCRVLGAVRQNKPTLFSKSTIARIQQRAAYDRRGTKLNVDTRMPMVKDHLESSSPNVLQAEQSFRQHDGAQSGVFLS